MDKNRTIKNALRIAKRYADGGDVDPDQYTTPLAADDIDDYNRWKQKNAPNDSGYDYDLPGAYKAGFTPDAATGHFDDRFKKPNHPTFSTFSQYAKDRPDLAGTWNGDQYIPPPDYSNVPGVGYVPPAAPDLGPSWLQQAKEQTEKDIAAYQKSGVPGLMAETETAKDTGLGFAGSITPAAKAIPKFAMPPKAGEVGRSWFDLPPEELKTAQHIGGQKGTSEAGTFTGFADGQDRYVKVAKSLDHAKNEVLASKLYELAGVPVAKNELTQLHGKPAVASQIVEGKQLSEFGPWEYPDINGLQQHMPADAWLANGDVIGAGTENPKGNIMVAPSALGHQATRIDFGGALRYAGLGGLKNDKLFGPKVGNFLEGLTSEHINPTAAEAFHGHQISPENVTAQRIAAITDDQIKSLVYQYGPTDMAAKEKLANTLIARRDDLAATYGVGKSLEQQMAEILPKKDNVVDLQGEPYTEPKPDFGHTVPQDDFKESMDALASLAKTAEYKPMQLNKQHSPEQYITALSGQTYGSALTKKAVTTKQGNKILENFQNMDQDKLAQALHGLPPEKMANVATWAKPGTIKKIWENQKKAVTPLSEVFGVEPHDLATEITQHTKDPQQIATWLYDIAKKNPELADEVNKLLPKDNMEDVANHMNYLVGKHGDPWAEPKFKSAKDYDAADETEYWNSVDKGIKDDWELAQGGTDFIKKIDKAWTSKFDKYFKPQDWMTYVPKEYTAGKHTHIETTPLQFPNKTPKELREMGIRPDIPIYKGGKDYPVGVYPERMPNPEEKYTEKAFFAGALHHTGTQYGTWTNPYVYGGKDLNVARINFKDAHNGNPKYIDSDMNGLIEAARHRGFDMVIIEDIADLGSHKTGLHTQFAFINTKGLRAPHAKFDPEKLKLNRPNPLWGLVGGGLFSYGMLRGQEGEEQKFARGGAVTTHKIGRDAFLYLSPKPPKDSFAQCGTCRDFTGTGCMILGQTRITKGMSCGLYVRGQPRLNMKGREQSLVSPEQAGLVNFQVRCENCKYGGPTCKLYEALNEELPDKFDLETKIDPKACCNGFTRDE